MVNAFIPRAAARDGQQAVPWPSARTRAGRLAPRPWLTCTTQHVPQLGVQRVPVNEGNPYPLLDCDTPPSEARGPVAGPERGQRITARWVKFSGL